MSRKDAVVLASRALALLFIVWALVDASHLPEYLHSFLHYVDENPVPTTFIEYRRHYYLIALGFLLIRIVGFSLLAMWLYRGGPEVEELFSPATPSQNPARD
jgi:hypothetical protein